MQFAHINGAFMVWQRGSSLHAEHGLNQDEMGLEWVKEGYCVRIFFLYKPAIGSFIEKSFFPIFKRTFIAENVSPQIFLITGIEAYVPCDFFVNLMWNSKHRTILDFGTLRNRTIISSQNDRDFSALIHAPRRSGQSESFFAKFLCFFFSIRNLEECFIYRIVRCS